MMWLVNLTGVGLSAIALVVVYKLASNHIAHSTDALIKFTRVLEHIETLLRERFK